MRLPHRLQGQKVKSQGHGAGAYCGGHLAAQLVTDLSFTSRMGRKVGCAYEEFEDIDDSILG